MAQALKFAPELDTLHQSGFRMEWRKIGSSLTRRNLPHGSYSMLDPQAIY